MAEKKTGRSSDQFPLRLPDGMRDAIRSAAEKSGRSMNAEIVDRLAETLARNPAEALWKAYYPEAELTPDEVRILAGNLANRIHEYHSERLAAGQQQFEEDVEYMTTLLRFFRGEHVPDTDEAKQWGRKAALRSERTEFFEGLVDNPFAKNDARHAAFSEGFDGVRLSKP